MSLISISVLNDFGRGEYFDVVMFVVDNSFNPTRVEGDGVRVLAVEANHCGDASAFEFGRLAVDDLLLHIEAMGRNGYDGSQHIDGLAIFHWGDESGVDVSDYGVETAFVDAVAGHNGAEVCGFSDVEIFEVGRIVEVSEHIVVVPPRLD